LTHNHFIHNDDNKSTVDIIWYHPSGSEMLKDHWHSHHAATLGYLIHEKAPNSPSLLCLFHAGAESVEFQLPVIEDIQHWQVAIDTTTDAQQEDVLNIPADRIITMAPFSTIVLLNGC
jgi:isoamylase